MTVMELIDELLNSKNLNSSVKINYPILNTEYDKFYISSDNFVIYHRTWGTVIEIVDKNK